MTEISLAGRAEQALLGALLLDPGQAGRLPAVRPQDFSTRRNARIFTALTPDLAAAPLDPCSAFERSAEVAEPAYLSRLLIGCPDDTHAAAYARMVREAARCRRPLVSGYRHRNAFDPDRPRLVASTGQRDKAQEQVLAAIIQQHPDAAALPRWLRVTAFTAGVSRDMYKAIVRLYVSGDVIDELTVDWEHARQRATPETGGEISCAWRLARLSVSVPDAVCYALLMAQRTAPHARSTARAARAA